MVNCETVLGFQADVLEGSVRIVQCGDEKRKRESGALTGHREFRLEELSLRTNGLGSLTFGVNEKAAGAREL